MEDTLPEEISLAGMGGTMPKYFLVSSRDNSTELEEGAEEVRERVTSSRSSFIT